MVIDLHKCTGCGACGIACKMENNTPESTATQTFRWADFFVKTEGKFPNVKYINLPVLCNHCTDAPCVNVCPVTPKAMFKDTQTGMTLHNNERCIGCRMCQNACPYSTRDALTDKKQYSVISFTDNVHPNWRNTTALIPNCTASPKEVSDKVAQIPPYKNEYTSPDYNAVRPSNVVEKCIFCAHRVANDDNPYCVDVCPAKARTFGNIEDSNSDVAKLVAAHQVKRLKNSDGEFLDGSEQGVRPNVYYIRNFEVTKI